MIIIFLLICLIIVIRVHLTSKEENKEFCELLHNKGFKYLSGASLLSNIHCGRYYKFSFVDFDRKLVFYKYFDHRPFVSFAQFKNYYMEKTITLTLEQAKELYKNGGEDIKNLLLTNFDKDDLEGKVYPETWHECLLRKTKTKIFYFDDSSNIKCQNYINPIADIRIYQNYLPSKKIAEQIRALSQLLICRDIWRNGWEPKENESYASIYRNSDNKHSVIWTSAPAQTFSFENIEIAQKFLNTFKDLINKVGDLI